MLPIVSFCNEAALTGNTSCTEIEKCTTTITTTSPTTALSSSSSTLNGDNNVEKVVDTDPSQVPLCERRNMAYKATIVTHGAGIGIVVATGNTTEVGKISLLQYQTEEKKLSFIQQIDCICKLLTAFITITAFVSWL